MQFGKTKIILLAGLVAVSMATVPVNAKKNIFKRSGNAIKEFFNGDKKSDEEKEAEVETKAEETTSEQPVKEKTSQKKDDPKTLEEIYDSPLDDNIRTPKLGGQKETVRRYQQKIAKQLKASGKNVETTRNGEVVIVTVPANDLFMPNETQLKATAAKYLQPFVGYLDELDFYRMLLVMHSDNTGSEQYTDNLTSQRVLAVLKWMKGKVKNDDYIIPYAMGASDPLPDTPNNSVENREKNRRLEIYLVPGKAMIKKASRGEL